MMELQILLSSPSLMISLPALEVCNRLCLLLQRGSQSIKGGRRSRQISLEVLIGGLHDEAIFSRFFEQLLGPLTLALHRTESVLKSSFSLLGCGEVPLQGLHFFIALQDLLPPTLCVHFRLN